MLERDARRGIPKPPLCRNFLRSNQNNNDPLTSPIRSPRAPPLHARTDHDRRSTGSFPPGGHRRSDLHTGGIDTPPQAVHRAPRLHRARVRRQRIQASAHRTWFPIRHFSRRFRRRRHRDGRARGVQTRVWEPDRCTQGRCTRRRHHRDAEAGNRPGPRGRRAPGRAGLGCYGCVDCRRRPEVRVPVL